MPLKIANQLLIDEAQSRGWTTEVLDEEGQIIAITLPEQEPILLRYSISELSTAIGLRIANSKVACTKLLAANGHPVPPTLEYTDTPTAQQFLAQHDMVVVKPSSLSQGLGITTNIKDGAMLEQAIAKALELDNRVQIQKHVHGHEHRFLVIGGKVAAVLRREPASVVGDGAKTVGQLIDYENQHGNRHASAMTAKKPIDADAAQGYLGDAFDWVPPAGEKVLVLGTSNVSRGGLSIDMTDVAHPSQKAIAEAAAGRLGLGVAGVDIISAAIEQPYKPGGSYILEVEENPGLRIHHFPSEGQPRNVAGALLDAILTVRRSKD